MPAHPLCGEVDATQIRSRGSSPPLSLRLREALDSCSNAFGTGDLAQSNEAVAAVVGLLNSVVESPAPAYRAAEEALSELQSYLSSPSSNQMVVDDLSLELPRVLVKFPSLSCRCLETVEAIIDCLVSKCSPRDMLLILCEALDNHISVSKAPVSYIPLLNGLSKVFLCIQRHHVEQVKAALPIVLRVLDVLSSDFSEEYKVSLTVMFDAAISIGTSIQTICEKMGERSKEELRAVLGLYVLQNIALISRIRRERIISSWNLLVMGFSQFLPYCGLSYLGFINGCGVAAIIAEVSKDGNDDFLANFSLAKDGACLSVIWGHISDKVAEAAGEQLTTVLNNVRHSCSKRWQALGMLRSIFSSIDYPWEIKSHSIELVLAMMDGSKSEDSNDDHTDFSSFMPSLFAFLQAIQRVMIYASDASLRKKAFDALRKVISDIPSSERFDILKALITNSESPSMIAILIDHVREEILLENHQKCLSKNVESMILHNKKTVSPFWSPDALDLVEMVLKPPKGGPPSLPEHTEPVLAALNLYRFILLIESTGKTNYIGVLSENMLCKAYSEWLLPLRMLVSGIQAENEKDGSELADDILCGLNPVQLVLHRCIELVEENMKKSK